MPVLAVARGDFEADRNHAGNHLATALTSEW